MFKCCAFGTLRVDIHIYKDSNLLENHEEIKVDEISLNIGGSVYNTVSVLNELKQDVVFYTLNISDDIADYIKLKLINLGITFITSKHDRNSTATSIIFVNKEGGKKMISCDGIREDAYILKKLKKDIDTYDLFYTSFYEINLSNLSSVLEIMHNIRYCFVDLSPLVYTMDLKLIESVLSCTQILSGTSDEYAQLLNILKIQSIEQLIERFGFIYLFEKKGSDGARMYYDKKYIDCKPLEKKHSRNTTGCGDTFNAGVIYSISMCFNAKDMLQTAVDFATMVAYNGFKLDLFSLN